MKGNKQIRLYRNISTPPPWTNLYSIYTRTCNAESQKRSAKGPNFKEDDRALPLKEYSVQGGGGGDVKSIIIKEGRLVKSSQEKIFRKPYNIFQITV